MPIPDASPDSVRAMVCYAAPDHIFLKEVELPAGATIAAAIEASGVLQAHPELDAGALRTGIFSKPRPGDTVVRQGDRVEIYRALVADPKTARRRRVQKARESGTREGQKWMRGGGDAQALES